MPWNFDHFMNLVQNAEHGFFSRGFVRSKSSLRRVLDLVDRNATPFEIDVAIRAMPADRQSKYAAAITYLRTQYKVSGRSFGIGSHLEFLKSPLEESTDCVIWGHAGQVPDNPNLGGTFRVPYPVTLHFYTIHGQANRTRPEAALARKPDDSDVTFNIETATLVTAPAEDLLGIQPSVQMINGKVIRKLEERSTNSTYYVEQKPKLRRSGSVSRSDNTIDRRDAAFRKVNKLLRGNDALEGKVFTPNQECWNYVVKNGLGSHWQQTNPDTDKPYTTQDIMREQDKLLQGWRGQARAVNSWVPHFVYVRSEGVVRLSDLLTQVRTISVGEIPNPIMDFYFAGCRGIHVGWRPHTED